MRKNSELTIEKLLEFLARRLEDFKGESKRSYQKAFSSFQIFVVSNYSKDTAFCASVIENWLIDCFLHRLTPKTITFYLDKISSLYNNISVTLNGVKSTLFKELKTKLKEGDIYDKSALKILEESKKITRLIGTKSYSDTDKFLYQIIEFSLSRGGISIRKVALSKRDEIKKFFCLVSHDKISPKRLSENLEPLLSDFLTKRGILFHKNVDFTLKYMWGSMALSTGILGSVVKEILYPDENTIPLLQICEAQGIAEEEKDKIFRIVNFGIEQESPRWYAMRLRPKINYEKLINRFSIISGEVKIPELFYPSEEIAVKIGRKVAWKGRPVIKDVVFFKSRKSEIYPLFTKIYDLAWCYKTPGESSGNYAVIPDKAMEEFKMALGFLTPAFDITPAGQMDLNAGDEVIIVNGEYAMQLAKILKTSSADEEGNKIFRVSLLNRNGHWDIGIDARLLKKK